MQDFWAEAIAPSLDRISDNRLRLLFGLLCLRWSWHKLRARHLKADTVEMAVIDDTLQRLEEYINDQVTIGDDALNNLNAVDPDLDEWEADLSISLIVHGAGYLVASAIHGADTDLAAMESAVAAFDALINAEKAYPQCEEEVKRWSSSGRPMIAGAGADNSEIASSPLLREALVAQREFAEEILAGRRIKT